MRDDNVGGNLAWVPGMPTPRRMATKDVRFLVDASKYISPISCAICGEKFIYSDEVWVVFVDGNLDFAHYNCDLSKSR